LRRAIDGVLALADGSRAPWVIGNHDVPRPVSRYELDEGFGPQTISQLVRLGHTRPEIGARRARAAALLLLALPGSAYIYQGEELGLPEFADLPAAARQDPRFRRTHGKLLGRDGCRVPLPWTRAGADFGFSETAAPAPPWLPQPSEWGGYSVEAQRGDPDSFLSLYQTALRLRREHPALGRGTLRWLDGPHEADGLLCFAREPGFVFAANLGRAAAPLPPHREILLASEPDAVGSDGSLRPDTAVWLST
jgi:alpha-glucosidase